MTGRVRALRRSNDLSRCGMGEWAAESGFRETRCIAVEDLPLDRLTSLTAPSKIAAN